VELASGALEGRPVDDHERVSCEDRWRSGDLGAAWPGGESGTAILARMRQALDEVADRHRGEAVLVVSHGGAMSLALPRLVSGAASPTLAVPAVANRAVVALEGDADGWRLTRPWPGSELG
ncbi:MAG TPA: histidine phosphatase family protein, partial [Candidatus Lustribacter sp.]|nr:histidine phosphatase family protein [Candidatus Lustribacter sp.]